MSPEQLAHFNKVLPALKAQVQQLQEINNKKDAYIASLEVAIADLNQQSQAKDEQIAFLTAQYAEAQAWAAQGKAEEQDLAVFNQQVDGLSDAIALLLNPVAPTSVAVATEAVEAPPEPTAPVEASTLVLKRPNPPMEAPPEPAADQSQSEPSV